VALGAALVSAVFALPSAMGASRAEPAVVDAAQVVSAFTGQLGVKHPAGLAYVPNEHVLLVAKTTPKRTRVLRIAGLRDTLGGFSLPKVSRPWTLSYDANGGGLAAINGVRQLVFVPASALRSHRPKAVTRDLARLRLRDPEGAAFDPTTRRWVVLDGASRTLVAVAGPGGGPLRPARIPLRGLAGRSLRGLALNPADHLLYTADVTRGLLYAVDAGGKVRKTYSIRNAALDHLTGLAFARGTGSKATGNLFVLDAGGPSMLARLVEFSLGPKTPPQQTVVASLGLTINPAKFPQPSPDTSGIVYSPRDDTLIIADSEVDETHYFKGVNLWKMKRNGTLVATGSTMPESSEPTGVGLDPASGALFVSDDDRRMVSRHLPGPDGRWGTTDDSISRFKTVPFGAHDPEGVCFEPKSGHLFIADGTGKKIMDVDPVNGVFGDGNDTSRSIDLAGLGVKNAEGIGYDPRSDTLVVADSVTRHLVEITPSGALVRDISLTAITPAVAPADVTLAPGVGRGGSALAYWIVDRGRDNNRNPGENDGRVYEIRLP
jgi:DNA-binding beta-propeller fold protein YncE